VAFVVAADHRDVGVVIPDVEGLRPDPLPADQNREPALLEPWSGRQRLGVVQRAAAVVSLADQLEDGRRPAAWMLCPWRCTRGRWR